MASKVFDNVDYRIMYVAASGMYAVGFLLGLVDAKDFRYIPNRDNKKDRLFEMVLPAINGLMHGAIAAGGLLIIPSIFFVGNRFFTRF